MNINIKLTNWMTTHEEIYTPKSRMMTAPDPDVDGKAIVARVRTGSRLPRHDQNTDAAPGVVVPVSSRSVGTEPGLRTPERNRKDVHFTVFQWEVDNHS